LPQNIVRLSASLRLRERNGVGYRLEGITILPVRGPVAPPGLCSPLREVLGPNP